MEIRSLTTSLVETGPRSRGTESTCRIKSERRGPEKTIVYTEDPLFTPWSTWEHVFVWMFLTRVFQVL